MKVTNATKQTILGTEIKVADNFFARLAGLLPTKTLLQGAGLLIKPCASVHTLGMRYAIDVIFVDAGNEVVKVVHSLPAGKLASAAKSKYVLELPAGTAAAQATEVGDRLVLEV